MSCRFIGRSVAVLLVAAAAAALVFGLRPEIDLTAAGFFVTPAGTFAGVSPLGRLARFLGAIVPLASCAVFVSAYLGHRLGLVPARFAPRGRSLAFLLLSLAIGPGLIVNGTLKQISHRPRPLHVEAFGGRDVFRPFYRFDGACARNCAFVSGEAAGAFWMTAPASLAPPPLRAAAVAVALLFGAATGGLRMAFGGHFLSDVVFAGLITLLVIVVVQGALGRDDRQV